MLENKSVEESGVSGVRKKAESGEIVGEREETRDRRVRKCGRVGEIMA